MTTIHAAPPSEESARLARGEHHDPHAILGAHAAADGTVVRAFHPDANAAWLVAPNGGVAAMEPVGDGLWAGFVADLRPGQFTYRIRFGFPDGNTWELDDPYRFAPTLGDVDLHLIAEGTHERLYDVLGAHPRTHQGATGVSFGVWAPNARSVRIVGDFDRWDGRLMPMRSMGASGVWELFVPGIGVGELYKFEVLGSDGKLRLKADPLAFAMQVRPETASRVWDPSVHAWTDDDWMRRRAATDPYRSPMAAYEVHLGSWMRNDDGSWLGYRQAAEKLAEHCQRFGFTHVELLPVAEHPFDGSWGYQVTGYYAPTSRFGNPDDFAAMVDTLHNAGIGVIVDWVPAHFPTDDFALRRFDGTPLYEHADPQRGEHPDWGTLIFDFGRAEVRNFLVANALFWCERYHIDGLRVDAVASMLYLDYSRKAGEWTPNVHGGRENLEAIAFLREMNERVYRRFPGVITIAEESTAFPGITRPTYLGGIGFGFKWDMGWMHDTLAFFAEDPVHRRFHHDRLTFRGLYVNTEHFVLPLSHDEVVHGKGSLLRKMPGDEWQRFANVRALLVDMWAQPGKKLLFMGSELGVPGRVVARPRTSLGAAGCTDARRRRALHRGPRPRVPGLPRPLGVRPRARWLRVDRCLRRRVVGVLVDPARRWRDRRRRPEPDPGPATRVPPRAALGRALGGGPELRLRALRGLEPREPRRRRGGRGAVAREAVLRDARPAAPERARASPR